MKNMLILIFFGVILSATPAKAQSFENFDILSYIPPHSWVRETGNSFISYTKIDMPANQYSRILLYASQCSSGNLEQDFRVEWDELVLPHYHPGDFTQQSVSPFKEGWIAKIGVAPFKYSDQNQAVILVTLSNNLIKLSYVFISNTTVHQKEFEDFGSSLAFGNSQSGSNQVNQVQNEKSSNINPPTAQVNQQTNSTPARNTGFTFTTSNFDDGWSSTIQNDWVLVEKNNARVYLFYAIPYNSDNFTGTGVMDRDYYWDNYVAPQFKITVKQYNDEGEFVSSLKPKYVEGRGTDLQTGETRFIAMTLSVSPNSAQITVASFPDEVKFRQAFPNANGKFSSDLTEMSRYNKFAIESNDLLGTWQNGGSQMTQWYDAVTGAYAGATLAASSATFSFNSGGIYSSIHNGATGAVGAMNTFQQEYKGSFSVTNWSVTATNRYQSKTENFDAHFQAVKGGRLLYLNDNKGGNYLLVKTK